MLLGGSNKHKKVLKVEVVIGARKYLVERLSRIGASAEVKPLEDHGILSEGPSLVTQQIRYATQLLRNRGTPASENNTID